jgi:hypothetical protein
MVSVFPKLAALQNMAVGATDSSATAALRFHIGGEIYYPQLGPIPPANGRGTSPVRITH